MANQLYDNKQLTGAKVYHQLPVEELVAQTLELKKGVLSDTGALVIQTGRFTGRSPADKFIVKDQLTEAIVDWNKFNNAMPEGCFQQLEQDLRAYLGRQAHVWSRDVYAGAEHASRLKLRVINEQPWCNHFAANMFIAPTADELRDFEPEWKILQAPGFEADPAVHGTRQANFTAVSFAERTILIGGSGYTGEIKKAVFTVLNYLLPARYHILSMHCSANKGEQGDTALFFGLSGTGKTTLSADPARKLIGDDEHGWGDHGIFNLEGGCYAKVINLSAEQEPLIFKAIRSGALVENTQFVPGTRQIDYASRVLTENTRASYPLEFIANSEIPSVSGVPANLFFLTCDAYGVFPPVSRLTAEQAMYYFISGYTAKIAGTEDGILEPQVTFSPCFGAPFLPLHPRQYARLLEQKIKRYGTQVWLVNTGWTGGPYGTGERISIQHTRAIITAILNRQLDEVAYTRHAIFGLRMPGSCPGVPEGVLDPRKTWKDTGAYDLAANELLGKFKENYNLYES